MKVRHRAKGCNMYNVSAEDRFLFDLKGFLLLSEVLSRTECEHYLRRLEEAENRDYSDKWLGSLGAGQKGRPTKEVNKANQIRLNGLLRLNPVFDELIDHSRVLPYLKEFVGLPQLINTWSISKFCGAVHSGWHRGVPTSDYTFGTGEIRSRMFNVVWFLTDNGPEDGCIVALPGAHKSNVDLPFDDYDGLELPGSEAVVGRAGDVLMFSETVVHNGLLKTSSGTRSNLYYNYAHAHYNVMSREPNNCHHFYLPPDLRKRLTPERRELTKWMELARWEY